jgi:hypothetical protein
MKYYFAARYDRHEEMRQRRTELTMAVPKAEVTSRWIDCIDNPSGIASTPEQLNTEPERCWGFGQIDLEDLSKADAIVSFTGAGNSRSGGFHVEHGVAIAYVDNYPWCNGAGEKPFRLIVVGPRENVFHCHPATEIYATWEEFLSHEVSHVRI